MRASASAAKRASALQVIINTAFGAVAGNQPARLAYRLRKEEINRAGQAKSPGARFINSAGSAEKHMPIRRPIRLIQSAVFHIGFLLSPLGPTALQAAEAEQITLHLASGRTFTGAVDRRTSGERLWLRSDKDGVSILRPVAWESIVEARRGEQTLSQSELLARVDELRSTRPTTPTTKQATRDTPAAEQEPSRHEQPAPLVQSLAVDATIASWSRGVDSSGLVLDVFPLDGEGCLTAADGTLEIDLFGDQYGSPTRGQDYRLLGHWVVRLEARAMTANGARFRLPFQAVSPDFRNDLSPYALVHVRLTAPGHGVFDATTGAIRLRRYDGLRDRLQQRAGSRFFSNEATSRGRVELPASGLGR